MSSRAIYLYHQELENSGYPSGCPFDTSRAGITYRIISSLGLLSETQSEIPPLRLATTEELLRFHQPAYLAAIQLSERGELNDQTLAMGLGTVDCPLFQGMYDYARRVAAVSIDGARLLLDGRMDVVFNPWGGLHHAAPAQASGFCYLNDVVLAAQTLIAAGKKVLFLDLDAHHGDGVQNAFYDTRQVMTLSLHESGESLFPGTGEPEEIGSGDGAGYSVNIPLPAGSGDEIYREAFERAALLLIDQFNPDIILLELGLDGLAGDPLTHLQLTNNIYADIVKTVVALNKPTLALGGGGYHVANTARGWALLWSIMSGAEEQFDPALGLGGIMLQNSDYLGGLRDRVLLSAAGQSPAIAREVR
ncbi:acetoin utilization protein AcuC, partial [bacterium]|nr:acetoin utilization protein AcuC [bacterium]